MQKIGLEAGEEENSLDKKVELTVKGHGYVKRFPGFAH
jgi:hypothetical protein